MTNLKKIFIILILNLLLVIYAMDYCQATVKDENYDEAIMTARRLVWKDINSGRAGSATVAIMDNGKIVYSEGFAMADREKSIPVTTSTMFNIGSISKMYCTVAVLLLVDDGRVELDAPVAKYLPEFTMADKRYRDITVRMLLNHTAGLPGTTFANAEGYAYNPDYLNEVLDCLARSNLKHAPGEMAPYCNDGFTLAEMLVEQVSGQKYIDFLSERIFKPLLLLNTGLSTGEHPEKTPAVFYQPYTAKKEPLEVLSVLGAGGLASTSEDLVRFADSFSCHGQQILQKATIEEMMSPQPSKLAKKAMLEAGKNPEFPFGLGLDIAYLPAYKEKGIHVIGKGGDTENNHAMLISAPSNRISVAVIETGHGSNAVNIAFEIFDKVLEQKGILEKEEQKVESPPESITIPTSYRKFNGYYASSYKITFDFKKNTVSMDMLHDGAETHSISLFYNGTDFFDDDNNRYYFLSVDGENYLADSIFDNRLNRVIAQQLKKLDKPQKLKINMNGKQWLRRNVKPYEGTDYALYHVVTSKTIDKLPGYVDFLEIKEVISPDYAAMPAGALSNQTELRLIDKDGEVWARAFDKLYSPANKAKNLESGINTLTVANSGYNEWFKASADFILHFEKPAKGRIIVFSPDGVPVYDSVIETGGIFVKEGSYIELAGHPGDVFKVLATYK